MNDAGVIESQVVACAEKYKARSGKWPEFSALNPLKLDRLKKELGARLVLVDTEFGPGVRMHDLTVVGDPWIPDAAEPMAQ